MTVDGIRCVKCGDEIYSKHRHDMRWCGCMAVAIDGGRDYIKITGNEDDFEYIQIEIKEDL